MLMLRWIDRYNPPFPLLGYKINKCLDEIYSSLNPIKPGNVFYVEGDGGTGKSEILNQINSYFGYYPNSSFLNPQLPITERNAPIYGGIIDMYDHTKYSGNGIEKALIENWYSYFSNRFDNFKKYSKFNDKNNTPQGIFEKYEEVHKAFQLFRFAMPNIPDTSNLVQKRRNEIESTFNRNMAVLCADYVPVFCIDTAELLAVEDASENQIYSSNNALSWLTQFLQSKIAPHSIVIIAGRPEPKVFQNQNITWEEYWRDVIEKGNANRQLAGTGIGPVKFQYFPLGQAVSETLTPSYLTQQEIKEYLFSYQNYVCEKKNTPETLNAITDEASKSWELLCKRLRAPDNIDSQSWAFPTKIPENQLLDAIQELTENGKPLLLDWLCQLIFDQSPRRLPGVSESGEINSFEFKKHIGQRLIPGWSGNLQDLEKEKRAQILRYAYIAQKGLDSATITWLWPYFTSGFYPNITQREAQNILEGFKTDRFIKIRSVIRPNIGQKLQSQVPFNLIDQSERFFLHDEIYESMSKIIEEELHSVGVFQVPDAVEKLILGYNKEGFPYSILEIEEKIRELRTFNLELTSFEKDINKNLNKNFYLSEQYWFENQNNIDFYLQLQGEIQNRLVERLYYHLKANFYQGYDDFSRIVTMAISEYEVGFDTRLQREFDRFEKRHYRSAKLSGYRWSEQLKWLAFRSIQIVESNIRNIKRKLRDGTNSGGNFNFRQKQTETLRKLAIWPLNEILEQAELDLQRLLGWSPKITNELKEVLLGNLQPPIGRFNENREDDKSNYQSAQRYLQRLEIARADALVTIYDYLGFDNKAIETHEQAINNILTRTSLDLQERQLGQVRDYQNWQTHFVLGRAYHNYAKYFRESYDLDKAIELFKISLEHFKKAGNRVEIHLNDTRTSLAYTYMLRGQQNNARELIKLSLKQQQILGHHIYVALNMNVMAQISLATSATHDEAFRLADSALKLFSPPTFFSDEPKEIYAYHLLQLTRAQAARRYGRSHARSFESSVKLLLSVENDLKETYTFFINDENFKFAAEAGNELGCLYRTIGRIHQLERKTVERETNLQKEKVKKAREEIEYVEALKKPLFPNSPTWHIIEREELNARLRWRNEQDLYNQLDIKAKELQTLEEFHFKLAETYLQHIKKDCQSNIKTLWFNYIDTLQDIAQLRAYQNDVLNPEADKEVILAYEEADTQLKMILNEAESNINDQSSNGKKLLYWLLLGKSLMHQADWIYKHYEALRGDLSTSRIYFKQNVLLLIMALECFVRFRPDILNATSRGYTRDMGYIARIEQKVSQIISNTNLNSRKWAEDIISDIKEQFPETIIGANLGLKNMALDLNEKPFKVLQGLTLFSYMLDINRSE